MGNMTMIVPTENLQEFNVDKVCDLLNLEFPQFTIVEFDDEIRVENKGMVVTELYFHQDSSHMINFDEDISELQGMGMNDLADKLYELEKMNPDLSNTLFTTYGGSHLEKNSVDQFLREYFKAYIFDEGIHPEFMPPDYQSKMTLKYKDQNPTGTRKFLKHFKDYFR
jgi:hypothetical protein